MTEEQIAHETARVLTGRADRERCVPLICPRCDTAALEPLPLANNTRLSCLCGCVFIVTTTSGRIVVTETEESSVSHRVAKLLAG